VWLGGKKGGKWLQGFGRKFGGFCEWGFWMGWKGRFLAFWCASETGESSGMKEGVKQNV
jgi:hypothetical protein